MTAELKTEVERHLGAAMGKSVQVTRLHPLYGGACQDNFVVEAQVEGTPGKWVLRSDAVDSLPGSIDRAQEYRVIRSAVAAGVPTPEARWPALGLVRPGAHAYFLDWVDGVAIGAKVLRDPALAEARRLLPEALARAMATVHRIPVDPDLGLGALPSTPPGGDPAEAAITFQQQSLARLSAPRPALAYALRWLERHRPSQQERCLVHGDFRVGNFLVSPQGLAAVLDWEFAHLGSPFEDLAWLCVRDWRFGQLKLAAGGLVARSAFYALYEAASGRAVRGQDVHFWEVVGNVRWAAGAWVQGQRFLKGEQDLELLAIARRASEMEYEALRLIEAGPQA